MPERGQNPGGGENYKMGVEVSFKSAEIWHGADGAMLVLRINNQANARIAINRLDEGKEYIAEIKEKKPLRSLNANAYMWVLCSKLANKVGITKDDVYRSHIKNIGVFRQVEIDEQAADTLIYSWGLHGVGWIAEKVDYTQHDGFILVNLYYGSSTYNTKQMSRLIDNLVQDCKEQGIDTMTPAEIALLLDRWEGSK